MPLEELLTGVFVYLAAAVVAAPLFARLGLGSVLGYLAAGMVLGPSVLGLTGEVTGVMSVAEFGVIVMLFLVGLELQPEKFWELHKPILGLGILQVVLTAAAIGGAALLLGVGWQAALVAGLTLAMSSTAIVLQSLNERGLMKTSAGRATFAVLLFQDVAVIPIFALLPLLAMQPAPTEEATALASLPGWAQTIAVLGAVALIVLAGRYLMQPLFRWVAGTHVREIFVAFALVIVVGITLLMDLVGMSAALGAFLGGVVLADSDYRHELEMDLEPFKGLLLAVFFIAVGSGSISRCSRRCRACCSAPCSGSWPSSWPCSGCSPPRTRCNAPMLHGSRSRWRKAASSRSCSSRSRSASGCWRPTRRACSSRRSRSRWRSRRS